MSQIPATLSNLPAPSADTTADTLADQPADAAALVSLLQRSSVRCSAQFLNRIIDAVGDPFWVKDSQLRFLLVNQALCDFTGIARERFIGYSDADLHPPEQARVFNAMDRLVMDTGQANVNEEAHTHADGTPRTIRTTKTMFIDAEGQKVLVGLFTDLTALRASQHELELANRRLHELAHRDSLTSLPNRMAFEAALAHDVAAAQRAGGVFTVMFMDLNGFKQINDTHGHGVGDELIRATAGRLMHNRRDTDFVARLGGDEFVVIARDTAAIDAGHFAERLAHEIARPYALSVGEVSVSVSIGCAGFPHDGEADTELMRNADAAMYRAKRITGQPYELYNASQSIHAKRHHQLLQQLRDDVAAGRIDIALQPVVELGDGRVLGHEALARWQHATLGEVPPSEFIPIAERARLIDDIGQIVLRKACTFIAEHGAAGQQVSVNLSAPQLDSPGLADTVRRVLIETGAQPTQLVLELPPSVCTTPDTDTLLHALSALGITLLVDDFGVGPSDLRRLQRLPLQALKLDRSFVHELDGTGAALLRTLVVLADGLGVTLIAKGIEQAHQAQQLRTLGIGQGQGYHLGRPEAALRAARDTHDSAGTPRPVR